MTHTPCNSLSVEVESAKSILCETESFMVTFCRVSVRFEVEIANVKPRTKCFYSRRAKVI